VLRKGDEFRDNIGWIVVGLVFQLLAVFVDIFVQ